MTTRRAAGMTEDELQRLVAEACKALHLAHYHTYDSRRSEPGFPDSVIVGSTILFRELKSDSPDARLTPEQRHWGSRIIRAGADWQVWRPAEWRSGLIMSQLLAIASDTRKAS